MSCISDGVVHTIDSPEFSVLLSATEASMSVQRRPATALCLAVIALLSVSNGAAGQAAKRDAIGDWLKTTAAVPSLLPIRQSRTPPKLPLLPTRAMATRNTSAPRR